jgi:iron complex transport system ATP-binding protein
MKLLETTKLSVGYKSQGRRADNRGSPRQVLSDLDLEVVPGRFVALLGPNGSGKSTLLRTIVGMQPSLSGSVTLGGHPLAKLDVAQRALRVAVVLTERFDPGWFTVSEIVAFGRYPYTDFRNDLGEEDRRVIAASLEAVGLADFAARRFSELSDGERQKAMIARALAQKAPLIVLDEPTAFLDAPARIEIFNLAKALARAGQGILLSTHEVDLALREADSVWLIDRAGGLRVGLPEDLALSGAIGAAFDSPRLAFDPSTGTFRAPEERLPFALGISGEDPTSLAWTIRLAERLGLSLEPERGRYDAFVRVIVKKGIQEWELESSSGRITLSSIGDLDRVLRRLMAGGAPASSAQGPNL